MANGPKNPSPPSPFTIQFLLARRSPSGEGGGLTDKFIFAILNLDPTSKRGLKMPTVTWLLIPLWLVYGWGVWHIARKDSMTGLIYGLITLGFLSIFTLLTLLASK